MRIFSSRPVTALMLALAGAVSLAAPAAASEPFSARIMRTEASGPAAQEVGALHVEGAVARLEIASLPDGFFLVDAAKPSAYYVRPQRKLFMEARQTTLLSRLLVPVGDGDPCAVWRAAAVLAGVVTAPADLGCMPEGDARIGDRPTTAYRLTSPTQAATTVWLARTLGVPVRVVGPDGARFDLFDLREEPQAAALFDLPDDFGKFDPQGLINRIKQSDVWVEPSK